MLRGVSKIRFSKLIPIIAGAILISAIFFQSRAYIRAGMEPDSRQQALSDLERLKNNRAVFEGQLGDLVGQIATVNQQLFETNERISKIEQDQKKIDERLAQNRKRVIQLIKERKKLVSELYILTDNPLIFVEAFVNTDRFVNLLAGKDEQMILIENKIKSLNVITRIIRIIASERTRLAQERMALEDEKQSLAAKAQKLSEQISQKQAQLAQTDLGISELEKYLLGLAKIKVLNNRDFVNFNKVSGDTYTFVGGGTDHGLGMSQYGAYGMAAAGKNYQEILTHYYQKTKIARVDTSNIVIRIGIVLGGLGGRIWVRGGAAKINQLIIAADSAVDVGPAEIRVSDKDGREIAKMPFDNSFSLDSQMSQTFFEVTYKSSLFNKYKGSLLFNKNGNSIITINQLNLEEYLKGVVPAEMSPGRSLEALKAQTVAARSYAIKHINPTAPYDMDDSTRYQVFLGAVSFPATDRAVDETRGQVIKYGAEIVSAYYHSTSGGYTENNENVWGGSSIPWLRGVESPWETDSPYWSWSSRRYNRFELENIFNRFPETKIGSLKSIEIINRGVSGRVIAIKITGTEAEKFISGQTFKNLINNSSAGADPQIISTLFGITE